MVYLDTNILVYLLEQHAEYSQQVASTLEAAAQRGETFFSSTITITEFLAGTTSSTLDTLHRVPGLHFVALDETLAEAAALLQRKENLQIGDAIHLATALHHKASLLFTNDRQLAKVGSTYLSVKTLDEVA